MASHEFGAGHADHETRYARGILALTGQIAELAGPGFPLVFLAAAKQVSPRRDRFLRL